MSEKKHHAIISACLKKHDLLSDGPINWQTRSGDGSDRFFYKIKVEGGLTCLAVLPSPTMAQAMAEAVACFQVGGHLFSCGVPVPEILAYDRDSGLVIYEDLGDLLLHDLFNKQGRAPDQQIIQLYRTALDSLLVLQIKGAAGFEKDWCWDTCQYDQQLILTREAGYFRDAFCRDGLGLSMPSGLQGDFEALASRATEEPVGFLIHRDFQSRNLMVQGSLVRIIDFQGARFGPLAYDLASLLNDPYANLNHDLRTELLNYYLDRAGQYIFLDQAAFIEGYYHIALCRNLQVLGAFSFLSSIRGKPFFKAYLKPALEDLIYKLEQLLPGVYPALTDMALITREHLES